MCVCTHANTERGRGRDREREKERGREGERGREREGGRERGETKRERILPISQLRGDDRYSDT